MMSPRLKRNQPMTQSRVSIVRCPAAASEEQIIERTREAIAAVGGLAERLRGKKKILVKPNIGVDRVVLTKGRQTELTEPAVVEGVIQSIREVSDAEILVGECPHAAPGVDLYDKLGYRQRLAPYEGVRLVDFGEPPYTEVPVPGAALQFTHYWLNAQLAEVDAAVSVAKMKAHLSMGCTLTIKNLFGLAPTNVYGQPRRYLHDRLIRLPRVLVDLASIFNPVLNVIDGIVTANHSEWRGEAIETGVILAGDNCVSTDAAGMLVMGFDPLGDYPNHPHWYRHNSIKLAHDAGLGVADPSGITLLGVDPEEVRQPFEVKPYGEGTQHRQSELLDGARCVEAYLEGRDRFVEEYQDRYLAFRDGKLLWDAESIHESTRIEQERGKDWRDAPLFTVEATPPAEERELFDAYMAYA